MTERENKEAVYQCVTRGCTERHKEFMAPAAANGRDQRYGAGIRCAKCGEYAHFVRDSLATL